MTLTATSRIAAQTMAMAAAAGRESEKPVMACLSIRFLEVDDDGVGEQEHADHRQEEYRVAQVDDAAHDGIEMGEEAERGDGAQHALGRPAVQDSEHDRRAAH